MKTHARLAALAAALALVPATAAAQTVPFTLSVRAADQQPAQMPGLQSFALGTWNGRWLLVGGRRNGFHRTSDAESTFPSRWANDSLYVVDASAGTTWRAPLPAQYRMTLRTNNAQHHQDGRTLFIVGGYGSNCDTDDRTCYQTYPTLTALDVPGVMDAIMDGTPDEIPQHIVSIDDERMRVTGGALKELGGQYYLVFGQNYDSIYKGGYTGKYTESIRRFSIDYDGTNLGISGYEEFTDPAGGGPASQYHRRDLNVVETWQGGVQGLTVYGGVFTPQGGAWLNPVYINPGISGPPSISVDQGFAMRMSPYETSQVLMYDGGAGTMYTSLLGGISFYYYDQGGNLVPSNVNNWMPFVNTITTLSRTLGVTTEVVQPANAGMPRLLGANSVFVPNPSLTMYGASDEVLAYTELPAGDVLLGHMVGGIWAVAPQSGELNPTYANNVVYEVWMHRPSAASSAAP